MTRRIALKAGARTRVLRIFSSSIPGPVEFSTEAQGKISGTVEIDRWHWFAWKRETHPLAPDNRFRKAFGDADYIVHVTPDTDCDIVFRTRHVRAEIFAVILALILIIGLVAAITVWTTMPPGNPAGL
ncbi:MAG: hypothetical protein AAFV19_07045 [Pseudomonadota bacterium]